MHSPPPLCARGDSTERGSILPLVLGYALLAIALIVVSVCATDLYIAQKRLDSVADAAALAGAQGFDSVERAADTARIVLSDSAVAREASYIVEASSVAAVLEAAFTLDGISAEVQVSTVWNPPLVSAFVPDGIVLYSNAVSRTALW
ncbi:pilus assembly protein TadG-related protein [Microbacterium sp. YY-01]|uniref:pilus assembly protein TadG-related protein n=1 Tax=Microbacterium sp. YY-01 TaxID=3421634 RepID=UPI003D16A8BB